MTLQKAKYKDIRNKMEPGDIIAFGGKGNFSGIIKWATRSSVPHVGTILQSKLIIKDEPQKGIFNLIIESTSLDGFSGVTANILSHRLTKYDGEVWWLPLKKEARNGLKSKKFYNFLLHQNKKNMILRRLYCQRWMSRMKSQCLDA